MTTSNSMHPDTAQDTLSIPLLIKAKEAARLLGIGQRKLWTMTNCGEVPCVRLSSAVRYSPESLRTWIARREKAGR